MFCFPRWQSRTAFFSEMKQPQWRQGDVARNERFLTETVYCCFNASVDVTNVTSLSTSDPRISTVLAVAEALGVKIGDLVK
jgi:hypothetical protein